MQSLLLRTQVISGDGVLVTVQDAPCQSDVQWRRQIYCKAAYVNQRWLCDIEIPTLAEHPGSSVLTFYVTVQGQNASYAISYFTGRENCHIIQGNGKDDGLNFCRNVITYSVWRWENYADLDNEAHCFYNQLYEHFKVQPCWNGVTQTCNETLRKFACYESFRRCNQDGFYVGTCQRACEAVTYECFNLFESVNLEHYTCRSARYVDELVDTCTGSDSLDFVDNPLFLENVDQVLWASEDELKERHKFFKSSAHRMSVNIVSLIVLLIVAVLLF